MGFPRRKVRIDSSKGAVEPKSMCRLRVRKTVAEFFSERGNNRLKRIWLDNNLDEEMIFSSWIGPSEALIRQKVSDYLQAFLLRRSQHVPFRDARMFSFLRRFSMHYDLDYTADGKANHEYFNDYVHTTLKKRCEKRENAERLRIERSIVNNELPIIPGFEYVSQRPIFKAEQLEKRMKYLSKIPFPYNREDFEKHILPIMTSLAIEKERKAEKHCLDRKNVSQLVSGITPQSQLLSTVVEFTEDSGVASDESISLDLSSDTADNDSELIQIFSEMELKSKSPNSNLDDTLNDVCDVCGGLFNNDTSEGLTCTCISDPIWDGKCPQTASSLFADGSKIVDIHTMKHIFCKDYMDQQDIKLYKVS